MRAVGGLGSTCRPQHLLIPNLHISSFSWDHSGCGSRTITVRDEWKGRPEGTFLTSTQLPVRFARTSVCQLAWRLLPRRWTEVLNVQKVLQKLCEPTYSKCQWFNNWKEKNYCLFAIFCSLLWGPVTYCSALPCFHASYLLWNIQLIFLTFSRRCLIWPALTLHSSSPPFILAVTQPVHSCVSACVRVCTPQRACLQPALKTFPQEMNEVSESLLASSVQPMQT